MVHRKFTLNKKAGSFFHKGFELPEEFTRFASNAGKYCFYLITCSANGIEEIEGEFQEITGYTLAEIADKGGLDFLFSLIHPGDKPKVSDGIIQVYQSSTKNLVSQVVYFEYRLKGKTGDWIWIREAKVAVPGSDSNDLFLGIMLDFTEEKKKEDIALIKDADGKECSNRLLKHAIHLKESTNKSWIKAPGIASEQVMPEGISLLTKREKEILQLVSGGSSTKDISTTLNISINTVETHRRHLLQKLKVKNSTELIKEASKVFWF